MEEQQQQQPCVNSGTSVAHVLQWKCSFTSLELFESEGESDNHASQCMIELTHWSFEIGVALAIKYNA